MELNKLFSEKNIGLPVKIIIGYNKYRFDKEDRNTYMYGRYYGHGFNGESKISDKDYDLIAMVTPSGYLIKGESEDYVIIQDEKDLNELEKNEKIPEEPYKPYLNKKGNKYFKTYEYKNNPLTFKKYPSEWFEINGFFDIDEDIFGNALSTLFSKKFDKEFYFQDLVSVCEASPGPIEWHRTQSKNLSIISPTKYDSEYSHYISPNPYIEEDYFDNLFRHFPVKINDEDFLVYFGDYSKRKIKLGKLESGNFVPNNFNPIQDYGHINEVKFNNPSYDFVSEFIMAIMQYKINNIKPNLSQEDMNIILEQFCFRIRSKNQVKKLINKNI